MEAELKQLAFALYDIDALKFGEFVTKVGLKTPVYFDLRVIISHPKIMHRLANALWKFSKDSSEVTQVCGVPYTALPLATLISVDANIPMLIKRKEIKDYGTKKLIEGKYKAGDKCVIIEDVVTSGSSILETVEGLKKEGLVVTEAFVVIDREQGGKKNIENCGIQVRSLYTVTKLMNYLLEAGKISAQIVKDVAAYLTASHAPVKSIQELNERLYTNFSARASKTKNPVAARLLKLMDSKQSTLCLSADLTSSDAVLEIAEKAGPHIVVLKTHIDIIEDFTPNFIKRLKDLSKKYDFLILEDRKFGDIGNTISLQFKQGIYKIAEWADIVTAHPVAGPGTIDGLKKCMNPSDPRGIFLVAEMSSQGTLTTGDYIKSAVSMAQSSDLVIGVVSRSDIVSDPGLIQLTPGVKLSKSTDELGQQYLTPESVVALGADLAVVGRGITEAKGNVEDTILEYKTQLWQAYKNRINCETRNTA